ncbi:MAG: twin-arginine translocation signal domain-containing protein [Deltaproteobacteria bacterium]|nr:twin-arginine translocation signal domain-containing protein [Deltaproteobacteria bacterium]
MTKVTRRSFLKQTSVSAATLSLLPAIPALAAISRSPEATLPLLPAASTSPMIAHVNDVGTGKITLLVGAREVVFHDRALVARLIKAAR